jgi:hypothetical protein
MDELVLLMKSVIGVVLRRDMSLNRRIYSWLLGQENDVKHFESFGLEPLCKALKVSFLSSRASTSTLGPRRFIVRF